MYFFYYYVEYYDDEMYKEKGITYGSDMKEALEKIIEYYGADHVEKLMLEYTGDTTDVLPECEIDKDKIWTDTENT